MAVVTRVWKVDGHACLIPSQLRKTLADVDPRGWWGLANGLHCPRGRNYGVGDFLLPHESAAEIDITSPIDITCEHEDGTTTWKNYYVMEAQAVSRHRTNPAKWLRVADCRWVLARSGCFKRYNLRNGTGATDYVADTINSGTPYTWTEIIADLWGLLPSDAGSVPSLPSSPSSTPENLVFDGASTWESIHRILAAIGMDTAYDPFAGSFQIIDMLGSQPGIDDAKSDADGRLLWRFTRDDLAIGNVAKPAKVTVGFRPFPGEGDSHWPFEDPPESQDGSISGGQAGTSFAITDTMFYLSTNSSERMARVNEIKAGVEGEYRPVAEPWGAIYHGILESILPGEEITDVAWRNTGPRGTTTTVKFILHLLIRPEPSPLYGAGVELIEFTIDSATTVDNSSSPFNGMRELTVTVKGPDCMHGALEGETATVYEHIPLCLTGDETDEDLEGRKGWAFKGVFADQSSGATEGDLTPCHFVLFGLCCPEE